MLENLSVQIVKTLMSELSAVTEDGQIDHKARLAALREARAFVTSLIPKMNKEDRDKFSHAMSEELSKKMEFIKGQEALLKSYDTKVVEPPNFELVGENEQTPEVSPEDKP